MVNNLNSETITACPRCYAKNPNPPTHFLAYDSDRPSVVICDVHGEMPIATKGPQFHFSHYEEP